MQYSIIYYGGTRVLGETPWPGERDSAKAHARQHFPAHQRNRGATLVEVRDADGHLVVAYDGDPDTAI